MDNKTITLYALFESELKVVELEARETAKYYIFEKRSKHSYHLYRLQKSRLVQCRWGIRVIALSKKEAISTFIDLLVARQERLRSELVKAGELLDAVGKLYMDSY